MSTKEEIEIRHLEASALKEEYSAAKIKQEIDKVNQEFSTPFYKKPVFTKSLIAGITLAVGLSMYAQYIFLPKQNEIEAENQHNEFLLIENQKQHKTEVLRLKLLEEIAAFNLLKVQSELNSKITIYRLEKEKNIQLQEKISNLNLNQGEEGDNIDEIIKVLEERTKELNVNITKTEEKLLSVNVIEENIQSSVQSTQNLTGWIYVGYFPNNKWRNKNLNIDVNETLIKGKEYSVRTNLFVRNNPPKFSILGYKYGDSLGHLIEGQKVIVNEFKKIGNNKIWAKIHTIVEEEIDK